MRVIVYLPDYNSHGSPSWEATMALSEGLKSLGVEHDVRSAKKFQGEVADIAIVNGWTKKMIGGLEGPRGKQNRNSVIAAQAAAGKPAWCIERGFLLDRSAWSAMSIGGFCSNGGDFRAEGMPSDRLEMFQEKHGLKIGWRRLEGDYVLLCAQVPWDAQVDDGNHLDWLEGARRRIRENWAGQIVFRPHPKAYRRKDPYQSLSDEFTGDTFVSAPLDQEPVTTFEQDLVGAHAVCCFNSNVATLALLAGVPAFTDADCLADPMAYRDWSQITFQMMLGNRVQWLNDLCYKQWHLEEFRQALPWLHLTRQHGPR